MSKQLDDILNSITKNALDIQQILNQDNSNGNNQKFDAGQAVISGLNQKSRSPFFFGVGVQQDPRGADDTNFGVPAAANAATLAEIDAEIRKLEEMISESELPLITQMGLRNRLSNLRIAYKKERATFYKATGMSFDTYKSKQKSRPVIVKSKGLQSVVSIAEAIIKEHQ